MFSILHGFRVRGRIIKCISNLMSHYLYCNLSHNVVNHAIGIKETFSNVKIVAKLLPMLQEVENTSRSWEYTTYNILTLLKSLVIP